MGGSTPARSVNSRFPGCLRRLGVSAASGGAAMRARLSASCCSTLKALCARYAPRVRSAARSGSARSGRPAASGGSAAPAGSPRGRPRLSRSAHPRPWPAPALRALRSGSARSAPREGASSMSIARISCGHVLALAQPGDAVLESGSPRLLPHPRGGSSRCGSVPRFELRRPDQQQLRVDSRLDHQPEPGGVLSLPRGYLRDHTELDSPRAASAISAPSPRRGRSARDRSARGRPRCGRPPRARPTAARTGRVARVGDDGRRGGADQAHRGRRQHARGQAVANVYDPGRRPPCETEHDARADRVRVQQIGAVAVGRAPHAAAMPSSASARGVCSG